MGGGQPKPEVLAAAAEEAARVLAVLAQTPTQRKLIDAIQVHAGKIADGGVVPLQKVLRSAGMTKQQMIDELKTLVPPDLYAGGAKLEAVPMFIALQPHCPQSVALHLANDLAAAQGLQKAPPLLVLLKHVQQYKNNSASLNNTTVPTTEGTAPMRAFGVPKTPPADAATPAPDAAAPVATDAKIAAPTSVEPAFDPAKAAMADADTLNTARISLSEVVTRAHQNDAYNALIAKPELFTPEVKALLYRVENEAKLAGRDPKQARLQAILTIPKEGAADPLLAEIHHAVAANKELNGLSLSLNSAASRVARLTNTPHDVQHIFPVSSRQPIAIGSGLNRPAVAAAAPPALTPPAAAAPRGVEPKPLAELDIDPAFLAKLDIDPALGEPAASPKPASAPAPIAAAQGEAAAALPKGIEAGVLSNAQAAAASDALASSPAKLGETAVAAAKGTGAAMPAMQERGLLPRSGTPALGKATASGAVQSALEAAEEAAQASRAKWLDATNKLDDHLSSPALRSHLLHNLPFKVEAELGDHSIGIIAKHVLLNPLGNAEAAAKHLNKMFVEQLKRPITENELQELIHLYEKNPTLKLARDEAVALRTTAEDLWEKNYTDRTALTALKTQAPNTLAGAAKPAADAPAAAEPAPAEPPSRGPKKSKAAVPTAEKAPAAGGKRRPRTANPAQPSAGVDKALTVPVPAAKADAQEQFLSQEEVDSLLEGVTGEDAAAGAKPTPPASSGKRVTRTAKSEESWVKRAIASVTEHKGRSALIVAGAVGAGAVGYAVLHPKKSEAPEAPATTQR